MPGPICAAEDRKGRALDGGRARVYAQCAVDETAGDCHVPAALSIGSQSTRLMIQHRAAPPRARRRFPPGAAGPAIVDWMRTVKPRFVP
jgi:hypothetical protein